MSPTHKSPSAVNILQFHLILLYLEPNEEVSIMLKAWPFVFHFHSEHDLNTTALSPASPAPPAPAPACPRFCFIVSTA